MTKSSSLRVSENSHLPPGLLARLIQMEEQAFGSGGMNEWFLPAFAGHGRVFVLWQGATPIGVAQCMRDWMAPNQAYLFGISLVPEARHRGWGRLFLSIISHRLAQSGFVHVSLTVSPGNSPALSLYRSMGFRVVRFLPDEYGPGEDRFFMVKQLRHKEVKWQ